MDLYTILGFISGGGITAVVSTILTLKYAKKTPQLDYTERLSAFWNKENENWIKRVEGMESQIQELYEMSCINKQCSNRKKAV